jgi:putative ATP-dependent endonuclease of the OLD family
MGLKLKSLYLENFKCYENSGEIPFHNLTVFIGENNAGKSTIYDALELVLNNNYPKNDDFREGMNEIRIKSVFTFSREIDELSQYNIDNTITIKKKFVRNAATVIEILGKKFLDDDLNKFKSMTAPDLKALLERLSLPAQNNQELRKSSIEEYINTNNPTTVDDYIVVNWSQISSNLPIFQRYSSSDYGNPTSSIRKTLDLVYREAFYEEYIDDDDGKIKFKLKDSFSGLRDEISESLNQKLETQLLANIKKYNQEIESVSGDYDIDFAKGLNFSGLIIKNNRNESRNIEQLGEGSKKKIFLSILEWDSEITSATLHNRNIIRGYDEPDAYLHYNAQREMFYMIQSLAENPESNMQSIICTHALTMIDRAPARTINHVIKNIDKSTISFLATDDDTDIIDFLNNVSQISGLKNTNIFYEKCFLLVEGEGEENALPIMYKTCYGKSLIESGVVLINLQTNGQWSNALKFLNKNKKDSTVLFLDADTQYTTSNSRVTKDKLEDIGFDVDFLNNNCFFIGNKEFEDVFCDLTYKDLCNDKFLKHDSSIWIENDFAQHRMADKFSEEIKKMLSRECRRSIGKPEISLELARKLSKDYIENIHPIKNLFEKINEIIN